MENRKDIGAAFRDKLQGLDKSPGDQLWANIEKELDGKKKKRSVFWLFPLVLTLGLSTAGVYYFTHPTGNETTITNPGTTSIESPTGNAAVVKHNGEDTAAAAYITSKDTTTITIVAEPLVLNDEEKNSIGTIPGTNGSIPYTNSATDVNTISGTDPKTKMEASAHNNKVQQLRQQPTEKISYSREATRISVSSKKLVKSTPEFDEYEVVKKYTYVVRKKKVLPKTKIPSSVISSVKSKPKAKHTHVNQRTPKKKTAAITADIPVKNKKKGTKKRVAVIQNSEPAKPLKDEANSSIPKETPVSSPSENKIITDTLPVIKETVQKKKKVLKTVEKPVQKDSVPKTKINPFEVFGYVSPTLSFSKGKNSPLDSRLNNNPRSSDVTFSYGAYLCYKGDGRLSARIGIGKTNLNFKTGDVPVNTADYSNIGYENGFSNAVIYSQSNQSETMTLLQDISYTEVPLEVKYRCLDRKIGVNAIAGFSYLYLSKNKVRAITANGNEYNIGRSKNLMDSSLGLNFGFGLDYKITKRLRFNMEPMIKYNLKGYHSGEKTTLFSGNILTGLQLEL